jgi:hypothetical protein
MAAPPRCNIKLDDTRINEVVSCVQNGSLRGLSADSASPTDVYIFKFVPNTYYDTEPVENGFMKVFVSNPQIFPNTYLKYDNEIKALDYEILVYERTKKLVDNNVIGHFVKYFAALTKPTSFDKLQKFISDKAGVPLIRAGLDLERNTIFMVYPQADVRPAINDSTPVLTSPFFLGATKMLVKYKFILTEAVVPYSLPAANIVTQIQDFRNAMPINSSIKLQYINDMLLYLNCSSQMSDCKIVCNTLLEIYFQLALTTYSMYINNFVHNDLHDGNVWIKRTNPVNIKYTLNNVAGSPSYTLTSCNNFSMLYDYDRAYRKTIDNPLLANSPNLPNFNQSNEMIMQRDFVKILCYMIHNLLPQLTRGAVKYKYRVAAADNYKMQIYNDLLNCICKNNTTGFVNWPVILGESWEADRTKWPNEIDRFRDFWDRIFNNIEIADVRGHKETNDNYECFLNKVGGKYTPSTRTTTYMELNHLETALYQETLYTMPEIIENLSNVINKYNPNKIQKNNGANGYYNYNIRRIISYGG